jgi:hypothetical protein
VPTPRGRPVFRRPYRMSWRAAFEGGECNRAGIAWIGKRAVDLARI